MRRSKDRDGFRLRVHAGLWMVLIGLVLLVLVGAAVQFFPRQQPQQLPDYRGEPGMGWADDRDVLARLRSSDPEVQQEVILSISMRSGSIGINEALEIAAAAREGRLRELPRGVEVFLKACRMSESSMELALRRELSRLLASPDKAADVKLLVGGLREARAEYRGLSEDASIGAYLAVEPLQPDG